MSKAPLEDPGEHRSVRPDSQLATRRRWLPRGLRLMPRGLGSLLLLLVVFSCTSGTRFDPDTLASAAPVELGPSELAEAQRRSLRHVFYRNNDAPPLPTPAELRRLDRDLATAPPVEVQELRDLFYGDNELLVYATRDSDGDGILDFRISEYRGKFFEGDLDLDGDGIRNVYDSAPFDPRVGGVDQDRDGVPDKPGSFGDRDGDGIPDHLDWSRRKPEPMPELQANLFRDFDVILVERSARFTPELVQAVDDTLRYVIRERLPTLRTVAVEGQLLISPDLGDNGFMLAQTQTLTVCTKSLEGAEPIVLLGLMIHELGHAWQLAQDFDESNLAAENVRMHFAPGRFTRSLERFGWKVDRATLSEGYHHRLYWPHFYATSPRYLYRGSSPNEWAAWFEDVQRESGPEFLRNSPAVTWGMVGPYSLTSPWEWHADHLMAALYNRIDRGVTEHDNRTYRNISGLLRGAMLESVQAQWSRYDYRNAVGTSIDRELGRRFALTGAEIELLVDRYVIPLADFPMLSEALALETAAADGFGGVGVAVGESWDALRNQLHEPMRQRPDLHAIVQIGLSPWDDFDHAESSGSQLEHHDDAGEDASEADEIGAEDGGEEALADPDTELLESADPDERSLGAHSTARSGLPHHRGGAGRVGGYVATEPSGEGGGEPDDDDLMFGAGDPQIEEQEPAPPLPLPDEPAVVGQATNPVVSLFEQLRRAAPEAGDLRAELVDEPEDPPSDADELSPASPE
jgi:hypothetical protein